MNNLCIHSDICGGCDFKGVSYEEQLEYKLKYCRNLFSRFKVKEFPPIIPSPDIDHYRNKMEFTVFSRDSSVCLGLRQKNRYKKAVDIKECRVFFKGLGEILSVLRGWAEELKITTYDLRRQSGEFRYVALRHSKTSGAVMIIIVCFLNREQFERRKADYISLADRLKTNKEIKSVYVCLNEKLADNALTDELIPIYGDRYIKERINGIDYLIGPKTFFQSNTSCCERLYSVIREEAGSEKQKALDIYCGSGGIALQLAGISKEVIGVDNSEQNIEAARENARLNNIRGVEFLCSDAESFLAGKGTLENAGTAIIDPPRSGLSKEFRQALVKSNIADVIYVSCNPINLRQDLILMEKSYSVEKIIAVDMFPWTRHIEAVARLRHV
jgi:23S rRNA (uracil-5-)-methyltransferase RumA